MTPATSAAKLADDCVDLVADRVDVLVRTHMPDFRIPRVFAGHAVGPDVRADLAFTLGLLLEAGVTSIAGRDIREALGSVLEHVDGPRTHTFFSYRIAETLLRLGRTAPLADNLASACDSTSAISGLDDGTLPRNYAAVLARCEIARARLGLIDEDDTALADLLERTRTMLASNPRGYLDDSRNGTGRYDIYTADVYLFTEPFADRLGDTWRRGAQAAIDLVERVGARNGAAFAWGRSTGALGIALTLELAGLVARHGLEADRAAWVARGANTLASLSTWFSADGVIRAHQYRSPYRYRGTFRRLQMSLDCLGKVVDAAIALRGAEEVDAAPLDTCFPDRNELVELDTRLGAAVWSYRSRDLAFVLPFVGGTASDYLPAPRNPGLLDGPVDSTLATALPFAIHSDRTYAPALPPSRLALEDAHLHVVHEDFVLTGEVEVAPDTPRLGGSRRAATYTVDGRTLRVEEHLTFGGELPHAVGLHIAEAANRPLRFDVECDRVAVTTTVDTAGVKEWRSFWNELAVVHQVDIEPAPDVRFTWSVTPKLRVLTHAYEHHYHRALYDPLGDDVADARLSIGRLRDRAALRATLDGYDIFHLHWPEWLLGADEAAHLGFIDALRESGVRVVWTQHNLAPHVRDDRMGPIYDAWATAADAVLHHSQWGLQRACDRYRFREDAIHAVVPHPHFGHLAVRSVAARVEVENALGLRAGGLRLGVIGAPRPGKDVGLVMRAFARCPRDDLELLVFSLDHDDEEIPDDPRIRAFRYEMVARDEYEKRLSAIDIIVLPFADDEMLTTGVVGDVVAHGIPALASSWPFLSEVLGDAAVVYGSTEDHLTAALNALDTASLDTAALASVALREPYAAETVARQLLAVLEQVGTSRL